MQQGTGQVRSSMDKGDTQGAGIHPKGSGTLILTKGRSGEKHTHTFFKPGSPEVTLPLPEFGGDLIMLIADGEEMHFVAAEKSAIPEINVTWLQWERGKSGEVRTGDCVKCSRRVLLDHDFHADGKCAKCFWDDYHENMKELARLRAEQRDRC